MKYILFWKDTFGRECQCNHPETWENIGIILNTVRKSGHYQERSFRIDFVFNDNEKET